MFVAKTHIKKIKEEVRSKSRMASVRNTFSDQ